MEWPVILLGVISGVLLLIGLFLPYREMAKRRGRVIGIGGTSPAGLLLTRDC